MASARPYQVQTWNKDGSLSNSYVVTLETRAEKTQLRKFLLQKAAHVVIAPVGRAAPKKRK